MNRAASKNKLIEMLSSSPSDDNGIDSLALNTLTPYNGHPFKQYSGQRLEDMVESIKELGVLEPIIVRPHASGYEILSGHNRVHAAELAGLNEVPAIIMEGLSDDEARLIVTETNLRQRSFTDLSYREKSCALAMHIESARASNKYSAVLKQIDSFTSNTGGGAAGNSAGTGGKFRARDEAGKEYGLNPRKVSVYIAIGRLPDIFIDDLEAKSLSENAAYKLAQLSTKGIAAVEQCYKQYKETGTAPIQASKAKELKLLDDKYNGDIPKQDIIDIFKGKAKNTKEGYAISNRIINKFFSNTDKKNIEKIINIALEEYFKSK